MNAKLNGIKVWPGILGSHRSTGLFGVEMGLAFGRKYMKLTGDTCANTPSHNFIIVKHKGQLWIGDCVRPKAKLTSFKEYEAKIAAGEIRNVQLFEVNGVNRKRQAAAATWWMDNVLGQPYDSDAFFRLGLKVIFGDWFPKAAGKDWKWWCTEGNKDAYKNGARFDLYKNENPTPFTHIKRWREGKMRLLEADEVPEKFDRETGNLI